MATHQSRIVVLGAGIMGSSVALFLARRGCNVVLVDQAAAPLMGASRWNEGKIHLGYLYAADPSLDSARCMVPGGLAFLPLMEELTGTSLATAITAEDDLFLVHRDSVVDAAATAAYAMRLDRLVSNHPQARAYLRDATGARAQVLTAAELDRLVDTRVAQAGLRVPERSISTMLVADRLTHALHAEPRIELRMNTRVTGVRACDCGRRRWSVQAAGLSGEWFDVVVNALWESRLMIDRDAGLVPSPDWSHRYRLCLFVRTAKVVDAPSAILVTGPFGDIKNYNGRDFYLSWYPAGLVTEGHALAPPALPILDAAALRRIAAAIGQGLSAALPGAAAVIDAAEQVRVEGGWVFAQGRGSLAQAASSIHRRNRFGVRQQGGYYSVDTGKYSTAPWMARQLAARIVVA